MTISLELLAPAGNADIGIAAIDHGADAVYIGAPKFSARAGAGESLNELTRLIRYAHLYDARVYVALNTLLTDAEIIEAIDIINNVYQMGADGLIIQDVGLLELNLPPIPLIASTQMHNHTVDKVRFLEEVGFQRVILARELSLDEISEIRRQTSRIELEAFVHGSLCVSYSGQCYISQAVTGRSGNRGVCAQPCRSRYTLSDGDGKAILKDKYLLSLKDLNLTDKIPDLIAAGVTSFKIEGRYKGMDYVKNITALYRQILNQFLQAHPGYRKNSSGEIFPKFSPDPDRTFNRGWTQYFISGKKEKVASLHTQKSIGQYLGKITGTGRDFFSINRTDLANGDGLCFFTKKNDLSGFRVERVVKENIYPSRMMGLKAGVSLYRNSDMAFYKILYNSKNIRKLSIKLDFGYKDGAIHLAAEDENGNQAEAFRKVLLEPARNPILAREQLEKHLTGTGNTPYRVTELTISCDPGFLPASLVNGLRREVLDTLTDIRQKRHLIQRIPFLKTQFPYPDKKLDFRANVLNTQAQKFYERHGASLVEPAFETLCNISGKTVMTTRYCIRYQLDLCPKEYRSRKAVQEPLHLHDAHHTYRLEFDCQKCNMLVILENESGSRALNWAHDFHAGAENQKSDKSANAYFDLLARSDGLMHK